MERYSVCWEDKDHQYLQPLPDTPGHVEGGECFCNTEDKEILGQVLNNYDQETVDFYRWTEEYDRDSLGMLIERRSGFRVGTVMSVEALERGDSGRICKLRITGSENTLIVGKELEIRRILSDTHLKSSAFEAVYLDSDGMPAASGWTVLRLEGAGWGHGVGLCQIGAAVMASEGYTYKEILEHYYPGTTL